MTSSRIFLAYFILSVATTGVFAQTPATNPAPPSSTPPAAINKAKKVKAPPQAPPAPGATSTAASSNAPAPTAPPPAPALTLDIYMKELKAKLNLTDSEAKEITSYYNADGDKLKQVLNNDTLSPFEQAEQVSLIRDERNDKIGDLLHDFGRQRDFLAIEARYRVALTLLAADGGWIASAVPAPAK
jgi:predicted lipid-binding transport protein (Tim44 family)